MVDERRSSERMRCELWVEERVGGDLYFQRSGNISQGGVFFEQTIPHPIGTRVKLHIDLGEEAGGEVEVEGEIVNTPRGELGMGVRFLDPAPEVVERIAAFMASQKGAGVDG